MGARVTHVDSAAGTAMRTFSEPTRTNDGERCYDVVKLYIAASLDLERKLMSRESIIDFLCSSLKCRKHIYVFKGVRLVSMCTSGQA